MLCFIKKNSSKFTELYQRLPPSPAKFESICISYFPPGVNAWVDEKSESEASRAQEVISALRSKQEALSILPKMKPHAVIIPDSKKAALNNTDLTTFTPQMMSMIKTLSRVGSLELGKDGCGVPQGMLGMPVNACVSIALDVKDLIDLNKELKAVDKKIGECEKQLANIDKKMQIPNYDTKTPDDIKQKNIEALDEQKKKLAELQKSRAFVEAALK